jgi:prolyl-tRNA synthetase
MRQSQLFTKTVKELPKDETSYNAQALIRAGFIDKVGAGIYSYLPLGKRVLDKICAVIREEMDAAGGQEILMTALIPKENLETTQRWAAFDVLFRLAGQDQKEYALGATHEEIVAPLAKKFILSYKDLPFAVYQIQTKFRNEKRAKAGLLRGREFLMKDLYSFHADQSDLDAYYEKMTDAYWRVFQRLGLKDKTYLTYAAGGSFSKYSHEFQTLAESGEDVIYICEPCRVAVNKEIIAEQDSCPLCGNKKLTEKKAIEAGNIFKLGTKFSAPFGVKYKDNTGTEQPVVMGCYGLGPSRVMGSIVEIFHDEKGIIWPESVAPFAVQLISLNSDDAAAKIYDDLKRAGIEALYDDRDMSAGEKFADADLIGCPYRVVVSKKTLAADSVELKARTSDASELINFKDLVKNLAARLGRV